MPERFEIASYFTPDACNTRFWDRLEVRKVFPGADFESLKAGLNPKTYQSWLNCYCQLITNNFSGLNSPLDLTIATARSKFRYRPIWALTYSQKRFREGSDNLAGVFLKQQGSQGKYWRAEREFVMDNHGQNAIIERLVDGGGKVQRLAVLRVYDDQSYCYRYCRKSSFNFSY